MDFGSTEMTGPGGDYRLCWCGTNRPGNDTDCTSLYDFRMDLGTLSLVGPGPLTQHKTCISGLPCAFDGLEGNYLADGDRVMMLDTCGKALVVPGSVKAYELIVEASGASVSWGATPLHSAGGGYRRN